MKFLNIVKIAVLLVLITFAQFACNLEKPYEAVETTVQRDVPETKVVKQANGEEIYKASCASCHGENGEGTKKGISFLKGHALHHPEEDFIRQVTNGESDEMPAFKDKLSQEEIKAVVKYVREELQKKSAGKEDKPHKH